MRNLLRSTGNIVKTIAVGTGIGVSSGALLALLLIKPIEKALDAYEDRAYIKVWEGDAIVYDGRGDNAVIRSFEGRERREGDDGLANGETGIFVGGEFVAVVQADQHGDAELPEVG